MDVIEGISPAIAIDQTNPVHSSWSTVGTMTERNDHLMLLSAQATRLFCGSCGREMVRDHTDSIMAELLRRGRSSRAPITFDIWLSGDVAKVKVRAAIERQGYTRVEQVGGQHPARPQDRLRLDADRRDRNIEAVKAAQPIGVSPNLVIGLFFIIDNSATGIFIV